MYVADVDTNVSDLPHTRLRMILPVSRPSQAEGVLQEAAGAFGYLQSRVVPQLTTPRPEDLSQECTGMLAALCMAQVITHDCLLSQAPTRCKGAPVCAAG